MWVRVCKVRRPIMQEWVLVASSASYKVRVKCMEREFSIGMGSKKEHTCSGSDHCLRPNA